MTITKEPTEDTARRWADPVAAGEVDTSWAGRITVTRARSTKVAGELVAIEAAYMGPLLLMTREQAADLAEVLREVSGMASAPCAAQDLAQAVREGIAHGGRTIKEVSATTGISRYRLGLLLSGKRAMTQDELRAISRSESS